MTVYKNIFSITMDRLCVFITNFSTLRISIGPSLQDAPRVKLARSNRIRPGKRSDNPKVAMLQIQALLFTAFFYDAHSNKTLNQWLP